MTSVARFEPGASDPCHEVSLVRASSSDTAIRPLIVAKFTTPPYGGVETHVDTLARALLPEVEATVIAASPGASDVRADKAYRVVTARSYGTIASTTMSPGVLFRALGLLRSGRANLLHLHAPNPWGDLIALMAPDVPLVVTWHSDIVSQAGLLPAYRHVQRAVIRRATHILVTSPGFDATSDQLRHADATCKAEYCPLGIDVSMLDGAALDASTDDRIRTFAAGRPLALAVGRHVAYKGYDDLVDAMALTRTAACLVMIGSGPLTASLRERIAAHGLAGRILLLGSVGGDALTTAFRAADFFVMPSRLPSEAFGIASAEAMCFGLPTVVCELGNGVSFLNRHGVTSLVVPPGDPGQLALAIDAFAADPAMRLAYGERARAWVRSEFSVARMKDRMLDVYATAMARHAG